MCSRFLRSRPVVPPVRRLFCKFSHAIYLFYEKGLTSGGICAIIYKLNLPEWRNWQTHGT